MPKSGKRVIHFYNRSGSLEKLTTFLENIQKKVNFINLSISCMGNKNIKISISGSRDLQFLAIDKIKELAEMYLED